MLFAKFGAAFLAIGILSVFIPIACSVAIATVAYGGVPDMNTVGTFAVLYLTVPAFWVALTIALGTFIKSASGIAGIGFAVILSPTLFAGFVPLVNELSPTSTAAWAIATATGAPASAYTSSPPWRPRPSCCRGNGRLRSAGVQAPSATHGRTDAHGVGPVIPRPGE